ncbi:MAG: hypothetical protein ABSG68_22870 [Thermoguttaceae bacterium]|jgi:hypothetical protein
MTLNLAASPPLLELVPEAAAGNELRTQVWVLLSTVQSRWGALERRQETRYPFPHLLYLTPVANDGATPCGAHISVVGKHISERGLGFYHLAPLPYRRMIASVQSGGHWLGFLIDLNWCRFTKEGWYESGGRFLQTVLSPVE